MNFITRPSPRIAFGAGMLEKLPEFVRDVGSRRPLLVTDSGILAAGHVSHALAFLEKAGIEVVVFSQAQENPTNASIAACRDFAAEAKVDAIIGFGGGSSMDTAKGCNFLLSNGGEMKDYHGYGKATQPMLPFIAVPTTAGTGSECQSYALVSDDETHVKMACGDPKALACVALLDPELTASQPKRVATLTALDALAHAVESSVCLQANTVSRSYSKEAFRLLAGAIESAISGEATLEERGDMLLGAAMAGMAIENSMLGAAHACANPLTAFFDVTHGHAVALMLPQVIRYNFEESEARRLYESYEEMIPNRKAGDFGLADWIEGLVQRAGLEDFVSLGIDSDAIDRLAEAASLQWTGKFNPREVSVDAYRSIYNEAFFRMAEGK